MTDNTRETATDLTAGTGATAQDDRGPRRAEEPRYSRLQRILTERIEDGTYPIGGRIPTEVELAAEFSTSRFTVREALRALTETGYVRRRQGVGTEVISDQPRIQYQQSFGSLQELFQVAVETYYVLMGHEAVTLDAEQAARIGAREGEAWIRLDGVRWTEPGGRPICFIESFIPARFEALLPRFANLQGPFFDLLEKESGETIEVARQEIRALPMPPDFSRHLGQRPDGWSLQILRIYVTKSGPLIASFNWHPADQMSYSMEIRRTLQAGEPG